MEYEVPVFKVLSKNDTSAAPGHQGGIVIPKEISDFFPELPPVLPGMPPTVDIEIFAELTFNGQALGVVTTRYQHQTWGGKRSPERRLTANLGSIRDRAAADDIVLFQRSISDPLRMKLDLVTHDDPLYAKLIGIIGTARWGTLMEAPASNQDVKNAEAELLEENKKPFELFGAGVERVLATSKRIARVRAFQRMVFENFDGTCAMSNRKLVSQSGSTGIDAAHIVPLAQKGTNDIRNGLALSKELHWAFDCGLIAVNAGKILVSEFVKSDVRNEYLRTFEGKPILNAKTPQLQPDPSALDWHLQHVFLG